MRNYRKFIKRLSQEYLLLFLAAATLFLLLLRPISLSSVPELIHWPTIFTLSILLMLTTGIKQSGLVERWVNMLLQFVETERSLWLVLVAFAALSSMILTNDIALFLIIPFTLQLNDQLALRLKPLLVLETIAVNAGSMLTPIGNPQNIYLWQTSGVSFAKFVAAMLPVTLLEIGILFGGCWLLASRRSLPVSARPRSQNMRYPLAFFCGGILLCFLVTNHLGFDRYFLIGTALILLFWKPKMLLQVDWTLIILFIFLFVDMGIFARFSFLQAFNDSMNLTRPSSLFAVSAGYSQIISNVPATLLLSHYTDQWKYLAWGVNIGGNGLIIASFANLITLRLAREHKIGWLYHLYAIPFLIISVAIVYLWIIFI